MANQKRRRQVLQDKNMFMLNLIVWGHHFDIFNSWLCHIWANLQYVLYRSTVIIDVREAIFKHLQRLSLSYFDRRKTGVIMSNLTNDVSALQSAVVDNLISLITESVTLIGSLVSMLLIELEVNTGYIYYGTNGADYHKCVW